MILNNYAACLECRGFLFSIAVEWRCICLGCDHANGHHLIKVLRMGSEGHLYIMVVLSPRGYYSRWKFSTSDGARRKLHHLLILIAVTTIIFCRKTTINMDWWGDMSAAAMMLPCCADKLHDVMMMVKTTWWRWWQRDYGKRWLEHSLRFMGESKMDAWQCLGMARKATTWNKPSLFLLLYCVPLSMHEIFHSKRFHSLNYFPSIRAIYSSIKPPTNKNPTVIAE